MVRLVRGDAARLMHKSMLLLARIASAAMSAADTADAAS
jgi:hypothetical protein